jgi:hypothetical protein
MRLRRKRNRTQHRTPARRIRFEPCRRLASRSGWTTCGEACSRAVNSGGRLLRTAFAALPRIRVRLGADVRAGLNVLGAAVTRAMERATVHRQTSTQCRPTLRRPTRLPETTKAEALQHVLEGAGDWIKYPAAGVRLANGPVIWWAEREAAPFGTRRRRLGLMCGG